MMTDRKLIPESHKFLFFVTFMFIIYGKAHCGIPFRPSFVSSPPQNISCDENTVVTIPHNLNEVPVKVLAEVTVRIDEEDVVFNAFGSAQRDARTGIMHGGVVCLYNSTHVMVFAPSTSKGRLFYPGLKDSFAGSIFPQDIRSGVVVVKVWSAFDLPKPNYFLNWTRIDVADDTTTFLELEHGIGGYPDLVVVQIEGDSSPDQLISEASGAISVLNTRVTIPSVDKFYFGGVLFGYSESLVRIWAPSQHLSDNLVTLFYVKNGWGKSGFSIAETSGKIRVMVWKFDSGHILNDGNLLYTFGQPTTSMAFDSTGFPTEDHRLLLVQVMSGDPTLANSGFLFNGIGSSMTEGQDGAYGGLIYGRTSDSILLWFPDSGGEAVKDTVCIQRPWATNSTNQCEFGGLKIRFTFYKLLSIDDVECQFDETVNAFENATQSIVSFVPPMPAAFNDTLDLACQSGLFHISGDDSLYCSRDGKFVSDRPIVCSVVSCPDPRPVLNAQLPHISGDGLGDTVEYMCIEGYTLEYPGTGKRTCQRDSTWSGELPACMRIACPSNNMSVQFASFTLTGTAFMDNVTYRCDNGFPQTGGDLIRTCLENGSWSGSYPTCEYCECPCSGENSYRWLNMTLDELLAALSAELKVDKKKTAIAVRKKISVYEDRPLAKGLGSIGIIMLVFVFAIIIIPDVPRLLHDIRFGLHNMVSCCVKTKSHIP